MQPDHIHDLTSLDNAVAFRIGRLNRYLNRSLRAILKEWDLTPTQWQILFRLQENPGLSQNDLADQVLDDRPNISRRIDGLVGRDLVRRVPDPADGRRKQLFLTSTGAAFMRKTPEVIIDARRKIFAGIPQTQIDEMLRLFEQIEANIETHYF